LRLAFGLVIIVALVCSACGGRTVAAPSTVYSTVTHTLPAPSPSPSASSSTFVPPPASTVPGVAPGAPLPAGEVDGPCPYISTADAADIEGDRIYRTTVVTSLTPVGCRFYFWCCDFEAIADVVPQTFPSAIEAHNAMVRTSQAGTNQIGVH